MADGARIYTPARAIIDKEEVGESDSFAASGVYKFAGCSVLSINMTLGYNGTSSSVSMNLVEDTHNGDIFDFPGSGIKVYGVSLPQGGVGAPIIYPNPILEIGADVPFYFAGICTDYSVDTRNAGGRTIDFSVTDPKDFLTGVQCLLDGFALSQQVGAGNAVPDPSGNYPPRYTSVNNVIDVFGYWNYGMESDRNEYGMPWYKIREAIEAVRVKVKDVYFEFLFTGDTFDDVPNYYRIEDELLDVVGIAQKVADDAGSDFICFGRKITDDSMLVEFRGIKRTNDDPLTQNEISDFVSARSDIVEAVSIGREFKNEPDSSIIIGGARNANYVAYPSEYKQEMHLKDFGGDLKEDYNVFPSDIKTRLFGGTATIIQDDWEDPGLPSGQVAYDVDSGAIYPFWGFTPDDMAYPLIEPFLFLDHLVFDKISTAAGDLQNRTPSCLIATSGFLVREVDHTKVFLDGDEDSDIRPFAYLHSYELGEEPLNEGTVKGLPLNTEVLRAALVGKDAFWSLYALHYPDIAANFMLPGLNVQGISDYISSNDGGDLLSMPIENFLYSYQDVYGSLAEEVRDVRGRVAKSTAWNNMTASNKEAAVLDRYLTIIYEEVRQYAIENMGRRFIVALPKSAVMNRIWDDLPVPTRPEKPLIEYVVDQAGYWQEVPPDLDGIVNASGIFSGSQEDQIRRKFMAEDGRFYPMAVMKYKPSGNINFNSNGLNTALFQDFPSSEFRPNKLAEGNPDYIYISCTANQLSKRPDLALVELPNSITFDPTIDDGGIHKEYVQDSSLLDDEFIAAKLGIANYLWYFLKKNGELRALAYTASNAIGVDFFDYCSYVVKIWADRLYKSMSMPYTYEASTEIVMDLDKIIIPLTSTWTNYGPYYYTYEDAKGMVDIQREESLVPWNFERPPANQPWYTNLDAAGSGMLAQSLANLDYAQNANIVVAGFPEYGPGVKFGYNSNITSITVNFGAGGVKTTYNLSTYGARPGTYRKYEYDNVSRARIDNRETLPEVSNNNIVYDLFPVGRNKFPY